MRRHRSKVRKNYDVPTDTSVMLWGDAFYYSFMELFAALTEASDLSIWVLEQFEDGDFVLEADEINETIENLEICDGVLRRTRKRWPDTIRLHFLAKQKRRPNPRRALSKRYLWGGKFRVNDPAQGLVELATEIAVLAERVSEEQSWYIEMLMEDQLADTMLSDDTLGYLGGLIGQYVDELENTVARLSECMEIVDPTSA